MGAAYTVYFDLRFNETGYNKFSERLRAYYWGMCSNGWAVLHIPERDTLEGNMSSLLPNMRVEENNRFRFKGYADFHAMYGWELVLAKSFLFAMKACEEGSEIYVYIDSAYDKFEIVNGSPEWTH